MERPIPMNWIIMAGAILLSLALAAWLVASIMVMRKMHKGYGIDIKCPVCDESLGIPTLAEMNRHMDIEHDMRR
jgi:hypothetical protein